MLALAFAVVVATAGSCEDPYSVRRIRMRQDHLAWQIERATRRDERARQRLKEAMWSVEKWWRADVEHFKETVPTAGDYIW